MLSQNTLYKTMQDPCRAQLVRHTSNNIHLAQPGGMMMYILAANICLELELKKFGIKITLHSSRTYSSSDI